MNAGNYSKFAHSPVHRGFIKTVRLVGGNIREAKNCKIRIWSTYSGDDKFLCSRDEKTQVFNIPATPFTTSLVLFSLFHFTNTDFLDAVSYLFAVPP
jgi:hypothetical protein